MGPGRENTLIPMMSWVERRLFHAFWVEDLPVRTVKPWATMVLIWGSWAWKAWVALVFRLMTTRAVGRSSWGKAMGGWDSARVRRGESQAASQARKRMLRVEVPFLDTFNVGWYHLIKW